MSGTINTVSNNPSRECKGTEQHRKKIYLIRIFTENYLPKRNSYHTRGDFLWAKQTQDETPGEFWRRQIEIENYRQKTTGPNDEEKTLKLKKRSNKTPTKKRTRKRYQKH